MLRRVADDVSWSVDEDVAELPTGPSGPAPDPAPLLATTLGGQYELLAVLGRGGMGTVFRARDAVAGREVALKLLDAHPDAAHLERFRREGQLTAALDHPGIVKVHSAGEHQGRPYLVYELIEGGSTLADLLRGGGQPATALRRLVEVARAVGHAHRQGIVHRDLKPSNVLIDASGRAVVADFGLASAAGLARLTQTGGRVGTPHTMAPEQWRPELAPVGPPTDVWALGVMLYQALSGRHPFAASTLLELEPLVLRGAPSQIGPPGSVSPALEAVCLRALSKRPQDRQPDAGALADELEAALRGVAPSGAASGQRTRWRTALVAAGMLVGLALLVALPRHEADPGASPGPGASPTPTPTPARLDPQAAAALLAEAQRELAFVERAADPRHVPSPGELPLAARRARALERVERARELDPSQEAACARIAARSQPAGSPERAAQLARLLRADPTDPWGLALQAEELLAQGRAADALAAVASVGSAGDLVRGRALLALGRAGEAVAALERAAGDRLDAGVCRDLARALEAAGRAPEAQALAERAAALEGAHRQEAAQLVEAMWRAQRSMDRPPDEVAATLERALELDPLSPYAAFYRATSRYTESDPQGAVRGCAAVLRRAPLLLGQTLSGIRALAAGLESVQSDLGELLAAPGWTDAADDRLARALLLCAQLERTSQRELLVEARQALDQLLARDPALAPAWTLSGFVALRERDRARAARELAVAREACPRCPTRAFYEALLLGAQGAPREQVVEALALAQESGDERFQGPDPPGRDWLAEYTELAGYRGLLAEVRARAAPRPPTPPPPTW